MADTVKLSDVHPWGHNLAEYRAIFNLGDEIRKPLIGFAEGTSSVNSELTKIGCTMVSIDPIYGFTRQDLNRRLDEVMAQAEHYWSRLPTEAQRQAKEIAHSRTKATSEFLADFENGKKAHRYITAALPGPLPFQDKTFHLGLCAHFLLLYDNLGLDFHIAAITETLRICEDVRIYPTLNLQGQESRVLAGVINYFSKDYQVQLEKVNYGFQGLGNELLRIRS